MTTHTGGKPHQCSECGKAFAQIINLKNHMNNNTGDKPHQCSQCNKAFTQKSNLITNMKSHAGDKPHQYNDIAFKWKRDLTRHLKAHAAEKLCQYSSCNRALSIKHNHTYRRTNIYETLSHCIPCDKPLKEIKSLKRHQEISNHVMKKEQMDGKINEFKII